MAKDYSVEVCKKLEEKFQDVRLHRPQRISRFEPGTELVYDVTGLERAKTGRVRLIVEKFAGGGFAGQVYKVKILKIDTTAGPINGLEEGRIYAMKILIPPTTFSRLFRNTLYRVGFQGPFQIQVNPAAARAGALWQKFIRRTAKLKFGDENIVADIHATFTDEKLGSCGELSEWVDGRTWRLEVDDHLDYLKLWRKQIKTDNEKLGSPEYRAKRRFMAEFVKLLHDIGAYEFARQYEWSTCKSQPNCLKRTTTEDNPNAGLVAVDFRPGLVLLPFLPMSPGDFKLIFQGLKRFSVVQFDRGDIDKLYLFVRFNSEDFADMKQMLDELQADENIYHNSVPDITHNHVRLLCDRHLWSTILGSAVTGWKVRNIVDDKWKRKLASSKFLTFAFIIIGLIPFLGKFIRRIWARPDWRKHYGSMLTSWDYLLRAVQGRIAEKAITWHRAGRINEACALNLPQSFGKFLLHLPFSILPAGLHRFLTDWKYVKQLLFDYPVRFVKLYFNAQLREQWLREMVTDGQKKHILTDEDAAVILSQVNEPFIQKYLKSLAVHFCTIPITQIVSFTIAVAYVLTHPEMPKAQSWGIGIGIIALFQVVPISPGSLVRGFYVLYLVLRERNFKDYNIAVFLGFFKYIGYLAFPIQMAYHYPTLARFMAGHWATEVVHIVPVFGEHGALLEHGVFNLFYNWPLTIRRITRKRAELRKTIKPQYRHVGLYAVATAAILSIVDYVYLNKVGQLPTVGKIWCFVTILSLACGSLVTLGCGGAALSRRIIASVFCGIGIGVLYTIAASIIAHRPDIAIGQVLTAGIWRIFISAIFSATGAIITELKLPDPDL